MLGGKPGDIPMPLRLGHFAVLGDVLVRPTAAQVYALLYEPPEDLRAIAWTATRQRHASLRCGPCQPGHITLGTEAAPVEWDVARMRPVMDAVTALRDGASQDAILTGQYAPHHIEALGDAYHIHEPVVAAWRPTLHLQVVVATAPKTDKKPTARQEVASMALTDSQRKAAALVAKIAEASGERQRDALAFWNHLLARRLRVSASRPTLTACIADLMERLYARPLQADEMVEDVRWLPEEEASEVLREMRDHTLFIVALARIMFREAFEARETIKKMFKEERS